MAGNANKAVGNLLQNREEAKAQNTSAQPTIIDSDEELGEVEDDSFVGSKSVKKDAAAGGAKSQLIEPSPATAMNDQPAAGPVKTKLGKIPDSNANQRDALQKAEEEKQKAKADRKEEARKLLATVDTSHNVSIPNYMFDP